MKKYIFNLYVKLLCLFLISFIIAGCSNDESEKINESKNQLIINNGIKIHNYNQLLKAFKNGDKFLVEYYIHKDYSEKQLKAEHQGLEQVSNSLYIHHFTSGDLADNGEIEFSGSTDWSIQDITYLHTYNYIFEPTGEVRIKGSDLMMNITRQGGMGVVQQQAHKYNLVGHLDDSVIVYAYH